MLTSILTAGLFFAQIPPVQGKTVEAFSLRYIDIAEGQGTPAAPGQKYKVHYTGWLRDGTKFDSSVDRNEPFEFVQGRRQVIAGWEAGFEGMNVGGKRRLFIPYQMAYGEKGRGQIPPKAELIFDVELLAATDVPALQASAEALRPLKEMEEKVLGLAKAVPAEKYGWRPGPGVRSFGEVMIHIANGNRLLLHMTEEPARPVVEKEIKDNAALETKGLSKEEIVKALEKSFADVREALGPMSAGALGREVKFWDESTTLRGIYIAIDNHVAEHLGQAIAYARMNGIAPPWSTGAR